MSDLKLDRNTHDLLLVDGDFQLTLTEDESLAQRLRIKLLSFAGDWFLDITEGIPFYESILGKPRAKETVDAIFKQAILEEPEVIQIKEFRSSINTANRIYSLNFTVISEDGEESIPVELDL